MVLLFKRSLFEGFCGAASEDVCFVWCYYDRPFGDSFWFCGQGFGGVKWWVWLLAFGSKQKVFGVLLLVCSVCLVTFGMCLVCDGALADGLPVASCGFLGWKACQG